jgi:hypothetical protein
MKGAVSRAGRPWLRCCLLDGQGIQALRQFFHVYTYMYLHKTPWDEEVIRRLRPPEPRIINWRLADSLGKALFSQPVSN